MNATLPTSDMQPAVSTADFAGAMRKLPGAVCIVTAMDGDVPLGITASSAASLSAEPPSLLFSIHRRSQLHSAIMKGAPFAVHLLKESQSELANRFAGLTGLHGKARFVGLDWKVPVGPPNIPGVLSRLECSAGPSLNVATHTIFTGLIDAIVTDSKAIPLVYFDREFCQIGAPIEK